MSRPRPLILIVDDSPELLKLLSQILINAGYDVASAGRGREAIELARKTPPSLAVIDVLLPDMMGQQLATTLRRDRPLPVIFITGVFKGPRQAADAERKFQAAGYFEKPFDARKLIAVIERHVPPVMPLGEAETTHPPFDALSYDVDDDPPAPEGDVRAPVPGGAPPPRPPSRGAEPSAWSGQHRGELRDSLPQLLNAFYLSQQTGELGVQRGRVRKIVTFREGRPVFARSNVAGDRLGSFLVRVGKIDEACLQEATRRALALHRPMGEVLVEMGALQEQERLYFVGQQIKTIIYSLFTWEDGFYEVAFPSQPAPSPLEVELHPALLILKGVRQLYRPDRLLRLLAGNERLMPSLQPVYALGDLDLEAWEAHLLSRVDGTRCVSELAAASGQPPLRAHAFLYALMALSILERRG